METKRFKIDIKTIGVTAAKILIGGAASFGAGYIITRYGNAVILPTDKKLKKIIMAIGAGAMASMVGNATEEFVGKEIDECVGLIDNIKRMTKVNTEDFTFEEEVTEDVGCEHPDDRE